MKRRAMFVEGLGVSEMSSFVYWAIAHGIAYKQGKVLKYALICRRDKLEKLLQEYQNGIIWC
jgi:hypothetical protein